ncbi:MAG: enoyl-CoA hydratase-related protein, partial [Aestuariivirgaceae bacterium]
MTKSIDFETTQADWRHWRLEIDGEIAELIMDVDAAGGLFDGYELKLNSYDLSVDIELNDAIQRLRFEHPEVKVVILRSGKDKVFCAGANIRMLAGASHAHKVNFCKFTNETRNAMEDASAHSGQIWLAAVNGSCAGGGYELALACDYIMLTDDGSSTVSLPELPLLAVLPGTGGLTRVTDKRKVRRDHADVFCTVEEGIKGKRAVDWQLVDEVVASSQFADVVKARAAELAGRSQRPGNAEGVALTPLERNVHADAVSYSHVEIELDRPARLASITIKGPSGQAAASPDVAHQQGAAFWPLTIARELDDALLHLRFNELDIAVIQFR